MPPDITHCSLARFNKAVNLDSVITEIEDIKVNITEKITRFKLLRDLGPPSFTPKVIESYEMSASRH